MDFLHTYFLLAEAASTCNEWDLNKHLKVFMHLLMSQFRFTYIYVIYVTCVEELAKLGFINEALHWSKWFLEISDFLVIGLVTGVLLLTLRRGGSKARQKLRMRSSLEIELCGRRRRGLHLHFLASASAMRGGCSNDCYSRSSSTYFPDVKQKIYKRKERGGIFSTFLLNKSLRRIVV